MTHITLTAPNPYAQWGSRRAYLDNLADEMSLPRSVVYSIASVLGPNEDFDGLVTECEDAAESCEFDD